MNCEMSILIGCGSQIKMFHISTILKFKDIIMLIGILKKNRKISPEIRVYHNIYLMEKKISKHFIYYLILSTLRFQV